MTPGPRARQRRRIGLLLFDGVEEPRRRRSPGGALPLDAGTPEDGWDLFCLSPDGAPAIGAKTLMLGAHHSIDDAPALDVLHPLRAVRAPGRCSATRTTSTGSASSEYRSR